MIRQCALANTGIQFELSKVGRFGLSPDSLCDENLRESAAPDKNPSSLAETGVANVAPATSPVEGVIPESPQPSTTSDVGSYCHVHPPRTIESFEDKDLMCDAHDQLEQNWLWWLLELYPSNHHWYVILALLMLL
jgi:hypothetical protein